MSRLNHELWVAYLKLKGFLYSIRFRACCVKWFLQRGIHGVAEYDLWEFDRHLAKVIVRGVRELKERQHGYPGHMTEDGWIKILDRIIDGFELYLDEDYDLMVLRTGKEPKKVLEAKKLLMEYFGCLWD